ncbi:MAG: hypothetical protein JXQ99_28360 [Hyphomicrobiaceae bacterium]
MARSHGRLADSRSARTRAPRPGMRYHASRHAPPAKVERRYASNRQPIVAPVSPHRSGPRRQTYALAPRVERHTLPNVERRPRRAVPPVSSNEPSYDRTGWARWIGRSWLGHKTATGEMFDARRLTGAHASLPLPSFVYVTNKQNGRTILIRINDRVPAAKGRTIVVSQRAAELLGFRGAGRVRVDLQYGGPASPVPNEKHERAFLKQQPWYRNRNATARPASRTPVIQPRPGGRYPKPTYPRWDNTRR